MIDVGSITLAEPLNMRPSLIFGRANLRIAFSLSRRGA
jgi:hypothetical protein